MDEQISVDQEEYDVLLPPNARIGTLTFDAPRRAIHVQLADGGDERIVQSEDVRAFYGARIRHVVVTRGPQKAQGIALSSTALQATAKLPSTMLDPSRRGDMAVQTDELYYALAVRIEKLPELWYLNVNSFNFRKALGDAATYSTETNMREFIRRLCKFAPDAVRDGFFTAVLQGSPLPPPVDSLLEFFRLVSR